MKLLQHEPSPVCGKSSVKKGLHAYAAAAPFVLPGLLLVLAFVIYPMFFTIRIALSEYKIVQGEITFIGLENFKNVLSGGSRFWYAYRNNFLYALVTVPFILLGGMLFAYLINNLRRGQTIFRVGFYLPVITSWVIVSLVFQYMFNNSDRGLINYLLVDVLHVMDNYMPWLLREWSGNAAIWLMGIWKKRGLVDAGLSRGAAGDTQGALRGGGAGRRGSVEKILAYHNAGASPHDLLCDGQYDHRLFQRLYSGHDADRRRSQWKNLGTAIPAV